MPGKHFDIRKRVSIIVYINNLSIKTREQKQEDVISLTGASGEENNDDIQRESFDSICA